jgi:hypothetical protein
MYTFFSPLQALELEKKTLEVIKSQVKDEQHPRVLDSKGYIQVFTAAAVQMAKTVSDCVLQQYSIFSLGGHQF